MSASPEGLVLTNSNLDVSLYAKEKFGITTEERSALWPAAVGLLRQQERELKKPDTVRSLQVEQFTNVDAVKTDLLSLNSLLEAFGTPDTSSNLVMSTWLLLQAQGNRLEQLIAEAKAAAEESLEQALAQLQESLRQAELERQALELEEQQLQSELQTEATITDVNISAMQTGEMAIFSNQEQVSALSTRRNTSKERIMERLAQCRSGIDRLKLEASALGRLVPGYMQLAGSLQAASV